jgi:endonuclease/exonuclease/phosphatase family metal-dependent hydrolase
MLRATLGVLAGACALLTTACFLWGTEAADERATITVVDYNILHGLYDEDPKAPDFDRFGDRLTLLAGELNRLKPDILVLQEFVNDPPDGYPDVRLVLMDALGAEYRMVFDEAGSTNVQGSTLGRMTITRLPVVSSASRAIFSGRSAHRVTVQTKGGVIDIYNVHMEGPELVGHQELEVVRLLTFIDETERNQNPVILAGDFNSRPGDEALVRVKQYGYRDVAAEMYDVTCAKAGDNGCTRATAPALVNNHRNLADIRIDYMFARGGLDIDLRTVFAAPFLNGPIQADSRELLWVSDHIGIQATFEAVPQPSIKPGAIAPPQEPSGVQAAHPEGLQAPRDASLRRQDS